MFNHNHEWIRTNCLYYFQLRILSIGAIQWTLNAERGYDNKPRNSFDKIDEAQWNTVI